MEEGYANGEVLSSRHGPRAEGMRVVVIFMYTLANNPALTHGQHRDGITLNCIAA
jgi:hypothetical protein